jgi:hypothetical protein
VSLRAAVTVYLETPVDPEGLMASEKHPSQQVPEPRKRATLVNTRSRDTRQSLVSAALRLWSEGDFGEAYEATTPAGIARASSRVTRSSRRG